SAAPRRPPPPRWRHWPPPGCRLSARAARPERRGPSPDPRQAGPRSSRLLGDSSRSRHLDGELEAVGTPAGMDLAPERSGALAQASQSIASRDRRSGWLPVVDNVNPGHGGIRLDRDPASTRAAVTNDVGDPLPNREGQQVVEGDGQWISLHLDLGCDPGRAQELLCLVKLAPQRRLSVAGDGGPDFPERLASRLLDVVHLPPGLLGLAGEQLAGQLAFDRDDRERMTEQIVQGA